MKLAFTSLWIVLASSAVAAGSPPASDPTRMEAAPSVSAPSARQVELARQFVALSAPAEMMMDGVRAGFWAGASEVLLEIEDEGERSATEDRMEQLLVAIEPKLKGLMPDVLEAYAQVYAREFAVDELQQMIAFAGTPAGKHYLTRVDFLEMDPSLAAAQKELLSGIAPALNAFKKAMCAERAAKRLAAGDVNAKCPLSAEPQPRSS